MDDETYDTADEALLAELGAMFDREDGPPAAAVELARQSFTLRALDAELAALTVDSRVDASAVPARAGDPTGPQLLTFEAADLVIEVQVTGSGPDRRMLGHLQPAGPLRVEVRQPFSSDTRWVDVDDRGRFVVERLSAGPISLTCHRPGLPAVATQWTWFDDAG